MDLKDLNDFSPTATDNRSALSGRNLTNLTNQTKSYKIKNGFERFERFLANGDRQ